MSFNVNRNLNNKLIKKNVNYSTTPKITSNKYALSNNSVNLEQLSINNIPITATGSNINTLDVIAGASSANKALVVDSDKNISNVNTIGCTSLRINNQDVTGIYANNNSSSSNSSYITGIQSGIADSNKLITTNSLKNVNNLNSLTSNSLTLNNTNIKLNTNELIRNHSNIYLNVKGYIPKDTSDIFYSPSINIYISCTTTGYIYSSPDMKNWTQRYYNSSNNYKSIAYSPTLNIFVIVGLTKILYSSDNGVTWSEQTVANLGGFVPVLATVCWSPTLNKFCILGRTYNNTTYLLYTYISTNGTSWATPSNIGTNSTANLINNKLSWNSYKNRYEILNGYNFVGFSSDASTWSLYATNGTSLYVPFNNLYYSTNITYPASSSSVNYVSINSSIKNHENIIGYSTSLNKIIGINNNYLILSPDSINWEYSNICAYALSSIRTDNNMIDINNDPLFINNENNYILGLDISSVSKNLDLSTYTKIPNSINNGIKSICYSESLNLFAAISNDIATTQIITSPDNNTWTLRTTPTNNWTSLTWSTKLSLFVAVADSGTNRVMTSSDGINWSNDSINFLNSSYNTLTYNTISLGDNFSTVLLNDGTIQTIGGGTLGQLGNNTITNSTSLVNVSGISNAIAISSSKNGYYSLALLNDGTIKSWGRNTFGQLGDNSTTQRNVPVIVSEITNAIAISAGESHSLALLSDGTIKSWGRNNFGQLGDNSTTQINTPVTVLDITNAIAISAGISHSMALLSDGTIKSWGLNTSGQIGDNSTTQRNTPVTVLDITNAIAISASGYYSLALLNDGTIKSWGSNNTGQLGDNSVTQRNQPVLVLGINSAVMISAGIQHSMAILSDGTVKSWGYNYYGQLGDNSTTQRYSPVSIYNIDGTFSDAISISAGNNNSLVLTKHGLLFGFGYNSNSELSTGNTAQTLIPTYYKLNSLNLLKNIKCNTIINTNYQNNNWSSICWSNLLNLFAAISNTGTGNQIMTSEDGINWIGRYCPINNNWLNIQPLNNNGFITYANNETSTTTYKILTSIDGINWFGGYLAQRHISWLAQKNNNIYYSYNGDKYGLQSKYSYIITLNTFNTLTHVDTKSNINMILYDNNNIYKCIFINKLNLFILLIPNSNKIYVSINDAFSFIEYSLPYTSQWSDLLWIDTLNYFMLTSTNNTAWHMIKSKEIVSNTNKYNISRYNINFRLNTILPGAITSSTSYRYVTWINEIDNYYTFGSTSYAYSPELKLLINGRTTPTDINGSTAYGVSTSNSTINGFVNTTARIIPTNSSLLMGNWSAAYWCSKLQLFFIGNSDTSAGMTYRILYSRDGIKWSSSLVQTPSASNQILSFEWIESLNILVAYSNGASLYTYDGINWISDSIYKGGNTGCYSNELDLFVTSTTGTIKYGNPFTTLTSITVAALASTSCRFITWIKELYLFIGVTFTSTIVVSRDGINWVSYTVPAIFHAVYWIEQVNSLAFVTAAASTTPLYFCKMFSNDIDLSYLNSNNYTNYTNDAVNNWYIKSTPNTNMWKSVVYSGDLNLFVAIANSGSGNRVMTSSDGTNWTSRTSASDNNWTSVCWSSELDLFVSVSSSGSGNRVMTSSDGTNWTSRTSASDNNWTSVCWAEELNLFVAVSSSGTGNRVMTSSDGITWTIRSSTSDNNWTSVCWSNIGLFVAVSSSGSGNRVMTSPNGINWTSRINPVNNNWTSICWAENLTMFIAVSSSGTGNRVMTSIDGITWTSRSSPIDSNWTSICWANELNLAVAISNTGTNGIMKSIDGINWFNMDIDNKSWSSVCWAAQLGLFVAVSSSESNFDAIASNITVLDIQNNLVSINTNAVGIIQTPSKNLRFGSNAPNFGLGITANSNNKALRLTYNNSLTNNVDIEVSGLQINASVNGTNKIFNLVNHNGSTTGLKLGTTLLTASANDLNKLDITYGIASNSKALSVDDNLNISNINTLSTNQIIVNNNIILSNNDNNSTYLTNITSGIAAPTKIMIPDSDNNISNLNLIDSKFYNINNTNIINQPLLTNYKFNQDINKGILYKKYPSNLNAFDICWSPELSLFVTVGDCWGNVAGSFNRIMASSDGINWEYRTTSNDASGLYGICWSSELLLFVAVGNNGHILTSTDSNDWVPRLITGNHIRSVAWSPTLNLFVCVASSGTYRIKTSPNGITWTDQTSFTNTSNWFSIIWASGLSMFVAVANSGTTTTQIATSINGTSWVLQTSPVANTWSSITYSSSLNLLVAVANSGTNNRIMTSSNGATWITRVSPADNNWVYICWASTLNLFVAVSNSGTANRVMTSSNGTTWSLSTTTNVDINYSCITFSPSLNLLVAAGNNSGGVYASNKISTSNNGINWTLQNTNYDGWNKIIWVPEQNTYVGCSLASSGFMNRIIKSPDGINWTLYPTNIITSYPNYQLVDLIWIAELSLFIAIGVNFVLMSADAITWTLTLVPSITMGGSINLRRITWSPSLNLLVAIGYGGSAPSHIITSSDGINWTRQSHPLGNNSWYDISWSPSLNLFAAVNNNNGLQNIITSPDGINWTIRTSNTTNMVLVGINWISQLGLFICNDGGDNILKSPDGINWTNLKTVTTINNSGINNIINKMVWVDKLNCLVCISGSNSNSQNTLLYTRDLNTWYSAPLPYYNANSYKGIVYSNTLQQFIVYTGDNTYASTPFITYNLNTSQITSNVVNLTNINNNLKINSTMVNDAITNWKTISFTYANNLTSICYSRYLRLFVAVSNTGTGNRVITSPDGIIWIPRASAADNNWTSVCWSNKLTLLVAVSNSGVGNRIMTSINGTTWTIRVSPANNNWTSVCWSEDLNLFIAVANSGTGNRMMISANGIDWNIITTSINNDWRSICWFSEIGLFVAIASSGIGNRIMTSPDGITWTSRVNPVDNNWTSVCWAPELTLMVAVAESGTGDRIMTSPDGITWTARVSPVDNNWTSVCWAPEIRAFTAVASTGTNNRIITSTDGINWSIQTSPADNDWTSICWNSDLEVFIAVSSTGTNNRFLSSNNSSILSQGTVIKTNQSSFVLTQDTNRVGLGINNPNYQLHLSASTALKPGTSTWTISSDARLKENIENADLDICYNNIKNLPLKRYKWKDEYISGDISTDRHILGWIAQEVESIMPKSVKTNNLYGIEDCKTLNTDQIIANMHGCVKKLLNIYENQTDKTQILVNDINNIKKFIADNLTL